MKRPVGIVAMAVAGLWAVAGPVTSVAHAQKGIVREQPDAGWTERDYLLHYASTICVRATYATLDPKPANVLDALAQEAWAMVEMTRQAPSVYDHIHTLAAARGGKEAPARALAACEAWAKRDAAAILDGVKVSD